MRRALATALCGCAALAAVGAAGALEPVAPFTYERPALLGEARAAYSRLGATWAYPAREAARPLRLTITLMPVREVHAQLGELSAVACMNLFIAELRKAHERFFVANQTRPLTVGGRELPQFRWTGHRKDRALTGIVSCAAIDAHYVVVDFVDDVRAAATSFPAIRASLRTLAPLARPPAAR